MLEICIQTSYDQSVQLILKSYLPVVYDIPLIDNLYILDFGSTIIGGSHIIDAESDDTYLRKLRSK
jgi:hypothetical protein